MNKSIIIIYHYVQQPSQAPRMKGLLVSEFDEQIQLLLKNNYKIVTLGEFLGFYKRGLKDSEKYGVLTFDDGLKGHAANAIPVLKKYGVGGTFFVMTKPLQEVWMTPAHQLHFVLATSPIEEIKQALSGWLLENGGEVSSDVAEDLLERAKKFYLWDNSETAYIKYLLNMHLKEPSRSIAIRHLFDVLVGNLEEKAAQFYLNAEDLKQMRSSGMEIGSHTDSHRWLASLPPAEQEQEISLSENILEGILGEKIGLFSYPYGTSDSFSDITVKLLKNHQYHAAVTTDQDYAANSPHIFSLNRIDTNEI